MDTVPQRIALIVDDEPALRHVLARCLQRRGFVVLEAADNAAAMWYLEQHRPTIITTDMYRAGGTGIEFITQVRAHADLQQVPILFLSGSASAEVRLAAKQAGAFADMGKPFTLEALVAGIATVIPLDPPNIL